MIYDAWKIQGVRGKLSIHKLKGMSSNRLTLSEKFLKQNAKRLR
jgi:hypothetical protein